jgi:hypothetical protein
MQGDPQAEPYRAEHEEHPDHDTAWGIIPVGINGKLEAEVDAAGRDDPGGKEPRY